MTDEDTALLRSQANAYFQQFWEARPQQARDDLRSMPNEDRVWAKGLARISFSAGYITAFERVEEAMNSRGQAPRPLPVAAQGREAGPESP